MMDEALILGLGLLGVALLLIVVEVFVPSGGVISLAATAVAIAGVVVLFRVSATWGVAGILAILILGPMVGFFALQILPSTPVGRRMLFGDTGLDEPVLSGMVPPALDRFIGTQGTAVTDLRPIGVVKIGDERLDAFSEISFIRAGTPVRVTGVDPTQIRVRPVA